MKIDTPEIVITAATREALAVTLAESFAGHELFRSIPVPPEQNHLSLTRQVNVFVGGPSKELCSGAIAAMLAELGGHIGVRFTTG